MTQGDKGGPGSGDAENHGKGHSHAIHYSVDREPQSTESTVMTPTEILTNAGLDSALHYLILLGHHGETSYQGKPLVPIEMNNGMQFMSVFIGPTPVS